MNLSLIHILAAIRESFDCGWSSEEQVAVEIRARYEKDGYLCDTHTAVAFHVAAQKKRDGVPMVVLSTASPFKFPRSVLEALGHTAPDVYKRQEQYATIWDSAFLVANVLTGAFNLLPIPPLDGAQMVRCLLQSSSK